jgi:F-type H+-transporting ATPase subunit delta
MKAVSLQPPSVMDPTGLSLAEVYAEALLSLAEEDDHAERLDASLVSLNDLLASIPSARELLQSPRIRPEQRRDIAARAFADRLEDPLEAFLVILAGHGRFELLPAIRAAYRKMLNRRQGRQEVTLVTARPLDPEQRDQIAGQLAEALSRRLAVTTRIEPDLLGGMVVQIGDRVFDASVAGRVEQISRRLNRRRWVEPHRDGPGES